MKILTKFIPHKSGKVGKLQKQYLSYRIDIATTKLKEAGFLLPNGEILECNTRVEGKTIVLEHKKNLF